MVLRILTRLKGYSALILLICKLSLWSDPAKHQVPLVKDSSVGISGNSYAMCSEGNQKTGAYRGFRNVVGVHSQPYHKAMIFKGFYNSQLL